MAEEKKEKTIWQRLASGDYGTVNVDTNINLDSLSIINMGLIIFVAGILVILAYFALAKLIKA